MSQVHSPTLPIGYKLRDMYTIKAVLGQGGFGITYLAVEDMTDFPVVIKENYPEQFADRNLRTHEVVARNGYSELYRWSLESFEKEARTLRKLPGLPNVVRVTTVFKAMNTAYIVMEQVEGNPLEKLSPAGSMMPRQEVEHLLHRLLPALAELHSRSIIHRDIKPGNIMLNSAGEPVLIDFGEARPTQGTHTATIIGTMGYAPLEQLLQNSENGACPPQPNWDIYALGASCYRLITGKNPGYIPEKLAADAQLCRTYGAELLSSIDKARELNPADRWQSAQDWLNALHFDNNSNPTSAPSEQTTVVVEPTLTPQQIASKRLSKRNITESQYNNQLLEAAECGNSELLSLLITAGADVNKADKYGMTPLRAAACNDHTECVRHLLAAPGIDVNKADKYGRTPLSWAAREGHAECVRLLLAAPGIDVNKADKYGWAPLYRAAREGHAECMSLLLAAPGIDVNKADRDGYTPLSWAARNGRTECVKLLLAVPGIEVNKADRDGWTPLFMAAWKGRTECVKLLLAAPGIDVNKADRDGTTPLQWAAESGHAECVRLLLAVPGIDVNKEDKDGDTPLYRAARNGHTECASLIQAAGGTKRSFWERFFS